MPLELFPGKTKIILPNVAKDLIELTQVLTELGVAVNDLSTLPENSFSNTTDAYITLLQRHQKLIIQQFKVLEYDDRPEPFAQDEIQLLEKCALHFCRIDKVEAGKTLFQAIKHRLKNVATALVNGGADLNLVTEYNVNYQASVLHISAVSGDDNFVLLLLQKGAKADIVVDNETPLLGAARGNKVKCVQHLLNFGTVKDNQAALKIATEQHFTACRDLIIAAEKNKTQEHQSSLVI